MRAKLVHVLLGTLGTALVVGALSVTTASASPTPVAVALTRSGVSLTRSTVSTGAVLFLVENSDSRPHTFSAGGSSVTIARGKSARLAVSFAKPGTYTYVSAAPGRPQLRGVLNVLEACGAPAVTSVSVQLAQGSGGLSLSQTSVPCGQVTFIVSDTGTLPDNLHIFSEGPGPHASTPELAPGQTTTLTLQFPYKGIVQLESGDYPPAEPEFGGDYSEEAQLTVD
jgi:hypothetical protein